MNKNIFICALTTLTLAACSSDDDAPSTPPAAEHRLTVVVNETPFVSADGGEAKERMETRGSVITTSTLNSFYMNYGENRYTIKKVNQEWTTTPNTWPTVGNDTKITFYAYTAGTYYSAGNYLSFPAEENAGSTTDLLVAKSLPTSYNDAKGQVNLTFSHACAAIQFTVEITNTLFSQLGGNLTVSKIVLQNVVKQGDYKFEFDNDSWELGTTSDDYTSYTLFTGNLSVTTDPQSISSSPLFVIPQTLGKSASFEITYNTGKTTTISLQDVKWEAGHQYKMNIRLGTQQIQTGV